MRCSNCGAKLSCGCQKRVATDGKTCCTSCVGNYNNSLKRAPQQGASMAPNINIVTVSR